MDPDRAAADFRDHARDEGVILCRGGVAVLARKGQRRPGPSPRIGAGVAKARAAVAAKKQLNGDYSSTDHSRDSLATLQGDPLFQAGGLLPDPDLGHSCQMPCGCAAGERTITVLARELALGTSRGRPIHSLTLPITCSRGSTRLVLLYPRPRTIDPRCHLFHCYLKRRTAVWNSFIGSVLPVGTPHRRFVAAGDRWGLRFWCRNHLESRGNSPSCPHCPAPGSGKSTCCHTHP